jgi:serine protease
MALASPLRRTNDSFASAQPLTAPALIAGSLGAGAIAGHVDRDDLFRVALRRGETVQLATGQRGDAAAAELLVFDAGRNLVAAATERETQRCVRISEDGTYFVNISLPVEPAPGVAAEGTYRLRIGDGSPASCPYSTGRDGGLVAGELIVRARPSGFAPLARAATRLPAPELLRLPPRAHRNATLGALSHGGTSAPRRSDRHAGEQLPMKTAALLDTLDHASSLSASGQYEYVVANRVHASLQTLVGGFPPNDPYYRFNQRWHFEQVGLGEAMNWLVALAPQPSLRPIVAVIDSGVVLEHPDLTNQLLPGCDFTETPAICGATAGQDPREDPGERGFHGTSVAGVIAAETFNSAFGASVAPMAQVLPLRTGDTVHSESDVIQAMRYAAGLSNSSGTLLARPVDVINLSLGSIAKGDCSAPMRDTVAAVRAAGVVVVAAVGNGAKENEAIRSPARCEGVIAVGASTTIRTRAAYSNCGPELKVLAPGGDSSTSQYGAHYVYTTTASKGSPGSRPPGFAGYTGTSFAVPHVAGVVALMRWVNPSLTPTQVDTLISSGAVVEDLGPTGRDDETGYGLIDAFKAVKAADALKSP